MFDGGVGAKKRMGGRALDWHGVFVLCDLMVWLASFFSTGRSVSLHYLPYLVSCSVYTLRMESGAVERG